jgi:hypothetical protein
MSPPRSRANHAVDQQRHDAVQQHLHDEWNPLTVAERAIEQREKSRISRRHFQGRVHLAARERQRVQPVVVEAFPSPGMRRLDEHEREAEARADRPRADERVVSSFLFPGSPRR